MSRVFPVYALTGPESGDKSAFLKEIRAAITKENGSEPDLHRFYPFETLNGEMFEILENNALFSDHALVILSQLESAPAQLVNSVVEYCKKPSSSSTLVLISSEFRLAKKLETVIDKDAKKIFYEMFDSRKPQWVRRTCSSLGLSIDDDAVVLLLDLVENDTAILRMNIMMLGQFLAQTGKTHITEADIESYIQHTRSESAFSLFESMATGTYQHSLQTLSALMAEESGGGIAIISILLWIFRRLTSIAENREEGADWEDAAKHAKVNGKKTPLTRKKDHEIYRQALKRFSLPQCRQIIALLSEYDIKVRENPKELEQTLLEMMLSTIILHKGCKPETPAFLEIATDAVF